MMILNTITPRISRYERKYQVSDIDQRNIASFLRQHPALFFEAYPQRSVNNIYFDTPADSSYWDHLLNRDQRLKVRIRWYGDLIGDSRAPSLELKIKRGYVSSKVRYSVGMFQFNGSFSHTLQHRVFEHAQMPDVIADFIKSLRPTVITSYSRRYFESKDHRFRVTIDYGIHYFPLRPLRSAALLGKGDRSPVLMEVKYPVEYDGQACFVLDSFPFRITRYSKYVTGVTRVYAS